MSSHFRTGRFGRRPTGQRPWLSPTGTGGKSFRPEGRVSYESDGKRGPAAGSLLFSSTYSRRDLRDLTDLQMANQRVTEVGFPAHVRLKRPKRAVTHAGLGVPQGVTATRATSEGPRARPPVQAFVSPKRGSTCASARGHQAGGRERPRPNRPANFPCRGGGPTSPRCIVRPGNRRGGSPTPNHAGNEPGEREST